MRYFDAAEHERTFARKGMDVEAQAGSWREAAGEPLLGPVEVVWGGQLLEGSIALDGGYFHSDGAEDGRFISRGRPIPPLICQSQRVEAERLRGLHPDHAVAIDGLAQRFIDAG
jgi:hypothetical protein